MLFLLRCCTSYLIAQRAVRRARAPRAPWANGIGKADRPQMEERQATSTNGKSDIVQKQMDKWQTNIDPKSQKKHQNGTHEPKIGPKKAEHGTTRGQKWSQEGPKRVQKRSQTASRTKKRTKTTPRPSRDSPKGRVAPLGVIFRGPFGRPKTTQNGAENDPKSKRKSRSEKKRSKSIKDLSWSDLGRLEGAMWEPEDPKSIGKRTISCKFTFSKIRRFEEGPGNHLSGKKCQEERK